MKTPSELRELAVEAASLAMGARKTGSELELAAAGLTALLLNLAAEVIERLDRNAGLLDGPEVKP